MVRDPLVSIIIPVYNVEPWLVEALDSVINQTYEKLEIFIIDDGSTDASGDICDRYARADGRIRVIHQDNQGLSAARNAGLDRMTGEVCAFLDPDDTYERSFIEKLLTAMIREDADLVVCGYTIHYMEGFFFKNGNRTMRSEHSGHYERVHGLRALAEGAISVSVWNKLYRRELWEKIRFPIGCVNEDTYTTFRIFNLCHTIHVLDEPLYLHRKRQGSITTVASKKYIQDRAQACSHVASFIALNTPELFTPSHERKWRQSSLNGMIVIYINYANSAEYEAIAFREELRKLILSTGKEAAAKGLGFRTRVALHMLRICPWLLKPVYTVYCLICLPGKKGLFN